MRSTVQDMRHIGKTALEGMRPLDGIHQGSDWLDRVVSSPVKGDTVCKPKAKDTKIFCCVANQVQFGLSIHSDYGVRRAHFHEKL